MLSLSLIQANDAHVGVVKAFSKPSAPKTPTLPSDLASELSAYDSAEPTKADAKPVATTSTEELGAGAEAFLAFLEADPPKKEHAHH
jgi:F-type H+-transporting ATPase subunit h